jgi:mannose-6-phosphate isomerase-like protein (cupin superfamily)
MDMKKYVFAVIMVIAGYASTLSAAEIPKGLIDSKPDMAVLVSLDSWYASHPSPGKPGIVSETVFASPRSMVMVRTAGKGTVAGAHFHATADEIVMVVGGSGELLINGVWTPVKAGDVHVNPRGVIHDTRALNEDLRFISIYTPQLPPGGDANMIKQELTCR